MNDTLQPETKQSPTPAAPARNAREPIAPRVDVYETADGWVLEASLPGVNKDGLEITVEDNELTIVGRRTDPTPNATVLWRESSAAHYCRVFELDAATDASRIEAKIEQGLLTLRLPKSEQARPRKVVVNG